MKFLCDNCKAKYQIADEKVAGKTVRMKCRKCGHPIEVRAAVTETSTSAAPPRAEAPRPAAKGGLATSFSAAKPRAPQAPQSGALAGAFQRTVQDPGASGPPSEQLELSVGDEWYVAINGVPVGPVRVSELRRKAAAGAVTDDSLVWQEGLEEWRPVKSIPELAALVREAAQGNRPSLLSAPQLDRPSAVPPRAPQRPAPPAARSPEPPRAEPARAPEAPRPLAPSRSNVVPLHARIAAEKTEDAAPITAPLGGGAAALAPSLTPAPGPQPSPSFHAAPAPAPFAVADPFAVPPPAATPSLAPPAPQAYAPEPPPRRGGVPLWFWPILVFVLGFGGVAAFFVFKQPPPQPVVIQVPTPPPPTATEAKVEPSSEPDVPPPPDPTSSAPAAHTGKTHVASAAKPPTTAATSTGRTADLSGLLGGAGGPSVGGGGSSGGGAGGGLDSAAVQRVVRDRQAGVKRTCWERGGGDGKSSAKVTVAITVAPNGSVQSASANGDDPVVAKCIENQVRTWSFPAPGATTTVNVPFVFVRQ